VVAVVPAEASVLCPLALAVASSGVDDTPDSSSTVMASAEGPLTVTVTIPVTAMRAAFAAYQISPSACGAWVTPVAAVQPFPAESVIAVTDARAPVLRSLMVATSRSPLVVAAAGETDSVVPDEVLADPNDWSTPRVAPAG
jgi:hypothetical protein